MKAKTGELHEQDSLLAGRESPCRDNTIEGNVGVGCNRFIRCLRQATMAASPLDGNRLSPFSQAFCRGLLRADERNRGKSLDQLFSSGLIFFSNSSNDVSPLILSPLIKNVGVESTFKTSLAYF
jgi:hypothetical protein